MIYAIRTKTRREFAAVNAIRDLGLSAYVPAETLRRRLGKVHRPISRPICPGYAFVACEPSDIARVHALDDVADFLRPRPGADPSRLPADALAGILLAELFGVFDHTREPAAYSPKRGDKVKVRTGLWRDWIGEIIAITKREVHIRPDKGGKLKVSAADIEPVLVLEVAA